MTQTAPLTPSHAWKQVLTVFMAVVGPPAGAVLGFVAAITWSDCFISCGGNPNHLAGGLLGTAAGLLALSAPLLAGFLIRRPVWVAATLAVPVIAVLVFVVRTG